MGAPDPDPIRRAIDVLERALAKPVRDADDFDVASRLAEARDLLSKSNRTVWGHAGKNATVIASI